MKNVVKIVDRKLDIHIILDNYATHKHPKVKAWLAKNPRVNFHFVPTNSSWLNLIEWFFGEVSQRLLTRLAVKSVDQLIEVIMSYIDHRNEDPKTFV
jgi:transposase